MGGGPHSPYRLSLCGGARGPISSAGEGTCCSAAGRGTCSIDTGNRGDTAGNTHDSHCVSGTSDPIGSGFVASLAQPGGNLTGLMLYEVGIAGKWLGMLRKIAPNLKRAALVANPKTTAYDYFVRNAETGRHHQSGSKLYPTRSLRRPTLNAQSKCLRRCRMAGCSMVTDGTTIVYRELVITLAARHRLPGRLLVACVFFVAAGGSYVKHLAIDMIE